MIFYITSENNKNIFDFINEYEILNKNVIMNLTVDSLINFLKADLRNIVISYLILDIQVMKSKELSPLLKAFDVFQLLNPNSTVILYAVGQTPEKIDEWKEYANEQYLIIYEENSLEEQIQAIMNQVVDTQTFDTYEQSEEIQVDIKKKHQAIEDELDLKNDQNIVETIHSEVPLKKDSDSENIVESAVSPDILYQKASHKVKISEGKPIKSGNKKLISAKKNSILMEMVNSNVQESILSTNKMKKSTVTNLNQYLNIKDDADNNEDMEWNCNNIIIGIVGTERKVGTTTAAFHIANALASTGAKVSYSETNNHQHLEQIANAYQFQKLDDYYSKDQVAYYAGNAFDLEAEYNFIIFDLGTIQENTEMVLRICQELINEIIVVSGSKPYEQLPLESCLKQIPERKIKVLCNNVTGNDYQQINQLFKSEDIQVYKNSYEPDLFQASHWHEKILELFMEYKN